MDVISAHGKKILLIAGALYLIAIATAVHFCDIPERDMAHRYIPMAEAFAAGDFAFAFHPRVPPIQPLCGGIFVRLAGGDGFLGLKIASALWHLLGGFLIYRLFRTLYPDDRRLAVWGTLLYGFFPYMFHMAYSGLRESAKGAVIIMLALALVRIVRNRERLRNYLLLGLAAGLGTLVRAELTALGVFCLFGAAVCERGSGRFPFRAAAGTLITLAFVFGNALINFHFFGHAMPDVRFARLFLERFGRAAGPVDMLIAGAAFAVLIPLAAYPAAWLRRRIPAGYLWGAAALVTAGITLHTILTGTNRNEPGVVGEFFSAILAAMYYFVVPMGLIHVARQIFLRRLTRGEHVLLMVAAAHFALCILQIQLFSHELYVSSRYIYPATPLFFGFFLLGWEDLYRWLSPLFPRWFARFAMAGTIFGLCLMYAIHLPQPLYRAHRDASHCRDREIIHTIAQMISADPRPLPERKLKTQPWSYRNNRRPRIWFRDQPKISVVTYFVGGGITTSVPEADYIVAEKLPKGVSRRRARLLGRVTRKKRNIGVWRVAP